MVEVPINDLMTDNYMKMLDRALAAEKEVERLRKREDELLRQVQVINPLAR